MSTATLVLVFIPAVMMTAVTVVLINHYCAKERNREMMRMITTDGFKAAEEYTEHLMKKTTKMLLQAYKEMDE